MNAKARFIKQLSKVSGLAVLSRLTGFIRDVCQLSILGIDALSDAFTTAFMLPSIARKLTSEGLFNAAFIPIYQQIKTEHNQEQADIWASNVIWIICLFTTLILLIFELFMPFLLTFLTPGFINKPTWHLLITLSRIMFITIIGSTLSSLINSFWTAQKHYLLASIGSTICNVGIISATLFSRSIYQAAFSIVFGVYLQFVITLIPMRKRLYFRKTSHILHTKQFIKLLAPLIYSGILLQGLGLVSGLFASWLPKGQLTYINKAEKLLLLPISLIGVTLNTVLVPTLATRIHKGYITLSAKIALLLSCFVVINLISASNSITYLAFGFGKVLLSDTEQIAHIIRLLALSMPAWVLLKVCQASLASIKDTKSNLYGNIIHVTSYALLGLIFLSHPNMTTLAYISIASTWINCLFMIKRAYDKNLVENLLLFTVIVVIASFAYLTTHYMIIGPNLVDSKLSAIIHIAQTVGFFSLGFLLLYKLLVRLKL